jgi:ER membrane protein complex subunit 1
MSLSLQLPLMPNSFASYEQTVARVSEILSSPSDLESTTHVLAWGLDIYYALLRPARGFDMLQEDFSFALLTLALLGLLIGTVVMSRLVASAQVQAKWQ